MAMRIAVPDLVTNSYFPALAAEELGFYRAEGLEAHVELVGPATVAIAALRDGAVDLVAGGAHTTLNAFPGWKGAKLVVALLLETLFRSARIFSPWGYDITPPRTR